MSVLVTSEYSKKGIAFLESNFGKVFYEPWTKIGRGLTEDELINKVNEYEAIALITELDKVTNKVMDACLEMIFIGDCRGNPVNIDIDYAKKHHIPIFCTPARNAQAVSEHLIGMLICASRNIFDAVNWTKSGKWVDAPPHSYFKYRGNELQGKRVGFVGFGAIGKCTSKILDAFGCKIAFFDPYVDSYANYEKLDIDDIFSKSDIISINVPMTSRTNGMVTKQLLESMKEDVIFINTARAGVVDNEALYRLLKERRIEGAVLDVFEKEPPSDHDLKLIALDNVFATPHICGATYEVVDHQSDIINEQIKKHFNL